ncbi:hypothetical protein JCM10207_003869 [Rhodosporidiobolus poonsookiae]
MEELQSSNAVKAKGGAHGTTEDLHRPVSLLSLPDDLIYLVYSHFLDEAYADGRELCEPTPEACAVLVNKRIFKLCSPLLYRNLSLSDEDIELDYGLGQLAARIRALPLLQRLTIMDPPKLEDEAFSLTRDMPQLKHFNTPGSLFFSDNLFNLHAFIFSFPRLEILILQGFHTRLGSLTTAASISRVNPTELLLRYPTIGALLISLRSTSVLELRYRAFGEKREMRWRRASRDDEFTSDCWTIG